MGLWQYIEWMTIILYGRISSTIPSNHLHYNILKWIFCYKMQCATPMIHNLWERWVLVKLIKWCGMHIKWTEPRSHTAQYRCKVIIIYIHVLVWEDIANYTSSNIKENQVSQCLLLSYILSLAHLIHISKSLVLYVSICGTRKQLMLWLIVLFISSSCIISTITGYYNLTITTYTSYMVTWRKASP